VRLPLSVFWKGGRGIGVLAASKCNSSASSHSGPICPFCSTLNGKHSTVGHPAFSSHAAPAQAGNVVSMAADPHVIVQSLCD
jgi:hypothetical protein